MEKWKADKVRISEPPKKKENEQKGYKKIRMEQIF